MDAKADRVALHCSHVWILLSSFGADGSGKQLRRPSDENSPHEETTIRERVFMVDGEFRRGRTSISRDGSYLPSIVQWAFWIFLLAGAAVLLIVKVK
jgi:hypothetical protein